jgi:GTP-binding protein HflX
VALVGYTNSGKSTLMNALTRAGVAAEDKLFATLDPTIRSLRLPGGDRVMLADTVGFINKIPHSLIEAFKSTLEEVRCADLLLHLVDVSHPFYEEQIAVVEAVLEDIGAGATPYIIVPNKTDLAPGSPFGLAGRNGAREVSPISALTGKGSTGSSKRFKKRSAGQGAALSFGPSQGRCCRCCAAGRILKREVRGGPDRVTALLSPKLAGR